MTWIIIFILCFALIMVWGPFDPKCEECGTKKDYNSYGKWECMKCEYDRICELYYETGKKLDEANRKLGTMKMLSSKSKLK